MVRGELVQFVTVPERLQSFESAIATLQAAGTLLYDGLPPVHCVLRDGIQKRVCSADGRRWHWYRSHGVTELSLATPRRSVNHGHRRCTQNGVADLS